MIGQDPEVIKDNRIWYLQARILLAQGNYKKALDSLALDAILADQIVAEANVSFTMNMKMFQELETSFTRILIKLVSNWFSSLFQPLTTNV